MKIFCIAFAWETNTVVAWRKLTLLTIILHMDERIILHRSIEHVDNPALTEPSSFQIFSTLWNIYLYI